MGLGLVLEVRITPKDCTPAKQVRSGYKELHSEHTHAKLPAPEHVYMYVSVSTSAPKNALTTLGEMGLGTHTQMYLHADLL